MTFATYLWTLEEECAKPEMLVCLDENDTQRKSSTLLNVCITSDLAQACFYAATYARHIIYPYPCTVTT